jgi:hypothetical protein
VTNRDRMSGFRDHAKALQLQGSSQDDCGQSCPQHYPHTREPNDEPLGAPLSIREVSDLIGCSAWTVRQRYLPLGLPYLRGGPQGKLIFYRGQVIRWILQYQLKGGTWK